MKKTYLTPSVEIENTEMNQMIALSVQYDEHGNPIVADDSTPLTTEDQDWNIWSNADTDEE